MIHRSHRYRDNRYRDNKYRDNQKTMESEDDIKAIFKCTAKISDCQMPNHQKSLNDQKMYAKQLGQLFFSSKISYNFTIKLIL